MSASTITEPISGREVRLDDKYRLDEGTVFLSGLQALVRVLLQQHRGDTRNGLRTATFVSGYQGSPLGGFDQEVGRLRGLADEHELRLVPGLNEELALTAVYGSQLAQSLPSPRYDGVLGVWYGKNPGLDRAADALRHANYAGTHPNGGALALVGDDPRCKSSTLPSAAEATLAALNVPTFFPGNVQEVLDLGAHAIACSRASGLWSAMKLVTNVADAAATISVARGRVVPVIPEVEFEGAPYRHAPSGDLLAPASLELERTLFGPRLELARRYVSLNGLNPVSGATGDAWLGIVAAGRTFHDLVQALEDLGLGHSELERRGIRLLKVGALYPHDAETFARFAEGLDEVLVVEEKLPYLETALRDALYGTPDAPRIVGKRDEHGAPLLRAEAELDPDTIAVAVAARLGERIQIEGVPARLEVIQSLGLGARGNPAPLDRTPFFCSGCPHNSSTANPDGTLFGAGIGCHTMVMLAPKSKGTFTGLTQMGGEGAQFVGMQPYADAPHFVQNLGDGTFHHSGSLAVRFAVSAGLNVTYKLLYNDTVAMTGGQDVLGQLSVPDLTRWLALEGVARVIVTTEEPERYRGVALDPIARMVDRSKLAEAQAELAAVEGVTVLIHDQACAAELRRARKRGKASTPPERILIDERVCEGCGDCGEKSSCLSVLPVDTEFGRKTQIHQASCNKDFSCIEGDCPSFMEVTGGEPAAPALPAPPDDLPEPSLRVPREDFRVRMPGVGGTGVVTVSQILQMAALLDGRHAAGLDQTGLSQKGGPVISDVRISSAPIEGASRAGSGQADLMLGFDVLGAANPATLRVADPARTVAVVSESITPTSSMVVDTGVSFPVQARNRAAIAAATRQEENLYLDAQGLSEALFRDPLPANLLLLGAAYQHGCVPISAAALEQAIRLNGAGVETNLAAFAWGRAAVADPERVRALHEPRVTRPPADPRAYALLDELGVHGELRETVAIRFGELAEYQSPEYARKYVRDMARVAAVERERGAPGETAIADAYARGLHKLMAYKDEYEVARLHLGSIERARQTGELTDGAQVSFLLHPPMLRAMGLERKLRFRRTARPTFAALRAMRRLRGTRLDPFGMAEVRRVERELVGEYRALVDRALERLTPATHATVAEVAALPDVVRGFEDIKLRNVVRFRDEAARLEVALAS